MNRKLTMRVVLLLALILMFSTLVFLSTEASGTGYDYIEQTESQEVIALTEEIGSMYGICPELLQAIIFYESSNQKNVESAAGDMDTCR